VAITFAYYSIKPLLSPHLLYVELLKHLLILCYLFLRGFNAHFEVKKKVWRLNLLQPFLYSLVLFDKVFDSLVSVLYFFLPSFDLLGPWPVRICSLYSCRSLLLLLKALLIHFVYEHVNVFAHLLELIS
jgi:hypothetical protein